LVRAEPVLPIAAAKLKSRAPTVEPERMLTSRITRGERLIDGASMVAGAEDFQLWRAQRRAWSIETCRELTEQRGRSTAQAFERIAGEAPCGGLLAEDLPLELQRVREALDVLRSLAERLPVAH
jgi:hypothetical protein